MESSAQFERTHAAMHPDGTPIRPPNPANESQKRGLPRSIGSNNRHSMAAWDLKAYVLERPKVIGWPQALQPTLYCILKRVRPLYVIAAKSFAQTCDGDCWLHQSSSTK